MKKKQDKLNFNVIHNMASSFASARMYDYKYEDDIGREELREARYSNFLTDYAYIIAQYEKITEYKSSNKEDTQDRSLNVSITLLDSILKFDASD